MKQALPRGDGLAVADGNCNPVIRPVAALAPAAGPKRVRLTAKQREGQLLDIAEELFTQRGYEGVSIEGIARAANVTSSISITCA